MYGDDDKDFVGTLSPTGLFTPALDGPNPKRKFSQKPIKAISGWLPLREETV